MYYQQQAPYQTIRCYSHQQFAAIGQCDRCGMPGCVHCLQQVEYSKLCASCTYHLNLQQQVNNAKERIIKSWIFTGIVGCLFIGIPLLLSLNALVTIGIGVGIRDLMQCILMVYGVWSLYWGWGIMRDTTKNVLGDSGCLIWGTIPFWLLFGIFSLVLATAIGAFGGGFIQYYRAKEIIRKSQQM